MIIASGGGDVGRICNYGGRRYPTRHWCRFSSGSVCYYIDPPSRLLQESSPPSGSQVPSRLNGPAPVSAHLICNVVIEFVAIETPVDTFPSLHNYKELFELQGSIQDVPASFPLLSPHHSSSILSHHSCPPSTNSL